MNHALKAKIHSLRSVAEGNKHGLEATVVMETVASRASGLVKEVQDWHDSNIREGGGGRGAAWHRVKRDNHDGFMMLMRKEQLWKVLIDRKLLSMADQVLKKTSSMSRV